MKKLLAITLSLLMVFALVPSLMLTASADDNVVVNLTKNVEYTSLKTAINEASDGDELKLLSDITTGTGEKEGGSAKSFSLDMDGHTITAIGPRFVSVDKGKTISYSNGNIVFNVTGSTNFIVGSVVRETSTFNLTDVNISMSEDCKTPTNGLMQFAKTSGGTDTENYVNITRCNFTSKSSVLNLGSLTKYVITVTDSTLIGSSVCLNTRANDAGTITVSNSTLTNGSNFGTTALSTVVVADGESVYDSSDNLIEGIITDGRKLDPAIYTTYSSLTFKEAGSTPPAPVDPYEDIAGTTNVAAQLRIGNVNGIRFITNVNADKVAAAETAGYTVTFGTLIAPADLIDGELTFEVAATNYIDVVAGGYFKYNSGEVAGSIVGIKTDNVARDFIARGYVKLEKAGEDTKVYYASQPNEGRSLKTVAAACVADNSFFNLLNDAQKEQVTTWANAK